MFEIYFTRYAKFSGRAERSEYWKIFALTTGLTIGLILLAIVFGVLGLGGIAGALGGLAKVSSLAGVIPGAAVTVRRLHDVGKSGWFILLQLIPLVGFVILLVMFLIKPGSLNRNQYGSSPS